MESVMTLLFCPSIGGLPATFIAFCKFTVQVNCSPSSVSCGSACHVTRKFRQHPRALEVCLLAESELGTFFFVVLFLHPLTNDMGVGEISFQISGSRIKCGMT